jgi:hypothetical protein
MVMFTEDVDTVNRLCSPPAPALLPDGRGSPSLLRPSLHRPSLQLPRKLQHLVLALLPLPALGRLTPASRPGAPRAPWPWTGSPPPPASGT